MSQVMSKVSDAVTQKPGEKIQREQAEAEANARELRLKMQEHQRRFICHVDGCTNTSTGPKLEEFLGHWLGLAATDGASVMRQLHLLDLYCSSLRRDLS